MKTVIIGGIAGRLSAASQIQRGDEVVPNPDPVWELQPDDLILLLGTPEQLAVAGRLFEPQIQTGTTMENAA